MASAMHSTDCQAHILLFWCDPSGSTCCNRGREQIVTIETCRLTSANHAKSLGPNVQQDSDVESSHEEQGRSSTSAMAESIEAIELAAGVCDSWPPNEPQR